MMAYRVILHKQVKETSPSEIHKVEAPPVGLWPEDPMMTLLSEVLIDTQKTLAVVGRSSPCIQ